MRIKRGWLKQFAVLVTLAWLLLLVGIGYAFAVRILSRDEAQLSALFVSALYIALLAVRMSWRRWSEYSIAELIGNQLDRSLATYRSLQEQQLLTDRLKYVLKLLHAPRAAGGNGNNALSDLPWYLIMGTRGSGKTSLLTQSGLSASSVGVEACEDQEIRQHCDWHFSPDAVFVDTASRYLDDNQSATGFLSFLKLLKKHRKPLAINGVVLTINLPELIAATPFERDALANRLSRRVREYARVLRASPPIYLMLTKVDLLPGFNGVFEALSAEARQQPWGMTFPKVDGGQESVLNLFDDQFAQLLKHLRGHVEKQVLDSTTPLAAEVLQFAQHFAALRSVLKPFVGRLAQAGQDQPAIYLRALHFTSTLQSPGDSLPAPFKHHLINAFGLRQPAPGVEQATSNRRDLLGYFTTGVFLDVVFPDRDAGLYRPLVVQRNRGRLVAAGMVLLLFACLLGWEGLSLFSYRQWLSEVNGDLQFVAQSERSNDPSHEVQELELLRVHLMKLESFTQGYGSWRKQFDVYGIKSIERALESAYSQTRTKVLLEPVSKYLQNRLSALDEFSNSPADGLALAGALVRENSAPGYPGPGFSTRVRDDLNEAQVAAISEGYNLLKLYLVLTDP